MILPTEIRRSNRKTLSIKINHEGELIVLAPYFFSEKKIMDFVVSKQAWIQKHQESVIKSKGKYDSKNLVDGGYVYVLGEKYNIALSEVKSTKLVDKTLVLPLKYKNDIEMQIKKWLVKVGKDYLKQVLDNVSNRTGLSGYTFKLTSARTKWGSCSNQKEIMLNFRLMCCPVEIIEYVSTHELVHLKYLNHGKNFHGLLNYFYPSSKLYVKWLKDNSGLLDVF